MTTSQHKSSGRNWLIIGLVTLLLIALAYFLLRPKTTQVQATSDSKQELPVNKKITKKSTSKNLEAAIQELAENNEVQIILDNPYMEDCEVPDFLNGSDPFKKQLSKLARKYKLTINQPAPNEFILIGGTCQ